MIPLMLLMLIMYQVIITTDNRKVFEINSAKSKVLTTKQFS